MTDRVRLRYTSSDLAPVALPASINPRPGIVEPGDVVEVDADAAEHMLATIERDGETVPVDSRWSLADDDAEIGPYAGQTAAELRKHLDDREIDRVGLRTRAELVAALEAADVVDPATPEAPPPDAPVSELATPATATAPATRPRRKGEKS